METKARLLYSVHQEREVVTPFRPDPAAPAALGLYDDFNSQTQSSINTLRPSRQEGKLSPGREAQLSQLSSST